VSGQHLPADLEQSPTSRGSRPWQVTAAVPLLTPAAAAWGAAGVAVFRSNADDGVVPLLLFALPLSGVLVAVSVYGLVGLVSTWRGSRPGCGTYLPAIVMVVSMIGLGLAFVISRRPGRRTGDVNPMHWEPTMAVPLVLAAVSILGLVLLSRPAARRWFPPAPLPPHQKTNEDHRATDEPRGGGPLGGG